MELKDKVCIVTGAGSGLGAELTRQLVAAGAIVVLAGRREARLREVAARCAAGRTLVVPTDVTRLAQIRRLLARTVAAHGGYHAIFSNAGVGYGGPPGEVTPAEVLHQMKTNCVGPMWLITEALPELRRHREGLVVSTISLAGLVAVPREAGYVASKFAMRGFLEAMAREYIGEPPRYLLVYPGGMDTELVPPELSRALRERGISFKVLAPQEVAARILAAVRGGRRGRLVIAPSPDRFAPLIARVAPAVFDAKVKQMAPGMGDVMVAANARIRARNEPDEVE